MKIRYFQETDTLYIEFRTTSVVETKDLDELPSWIWTPKDRPVA